MFLTDIKGCRACTFKANCSSAAAHLKVPFLHVSDIVISPNLDESVTDSARCIHCSKCKLTFSHPSIFSLFRSPLLGFDSMLMREPLESALLAVDTANEEKAGKSKWVYVRVSLDFSKFFLETYFNFNFNIYLSSLKRTKKNKNQKRNRPKSCKCSFLCKPLNHHFLPAYSNWCFMFSHMWELTQYLASVMSQKQQHAGVKWHKLEYCK